MADPTDLKGQHAREFTNHELLTLRVWFDLDQAGHDDLAQKLLDAGLMLEHYTSLLDSDPAKRTQAEVTAQSQLLFAFMQVLDESNKQLAQDAKGTVTKAAHAVETWGRYQGHALQNFRKGVRAKGKKSID